MTKFRKRRARLQLTGRVMLVLIALLLLPVLVFALVKAPLLFAGGACLAAAPLVLDDEAFQKEVIGGVKRIETEQTEQKSRIDKVLADLDRADKEVKKSLEELTKVKNTCNDFDLAMKSMQKVQQAIARNARSSWRDPVTKALEMDEGLKLFLNAAGRAAAFPNEIGRLPSEMRKTLEEANAAHKALTGVDASLGQATIPSEWFKTIYDTLTEYGDWSSLDVIQVGARTNLVPVATARPAFYWIGAGTGGVGEGSAITEGVFAGDNVTLSIQTLAVYLLCARELLADSSVDMAPYIMKQLLQSLAFGLDTAAFIGAGTADQTNAGYYGIFNAGSVNVNLAATTAPGNTTVEATQLEDWQNATLTVSQVVLQRAARWWMNPQMVIRALSVRDKNGRPLFQTYTEAPMPGGIGSILGYPIKITAVAPTTNAPGATVAAFGDPQGQAVGIRSDMEFATSDDIKFAENMKAFRGLIRTGVKLKTKAASNTLKPISVLTLAPA